VVCVAAAAGVPPGTLHVARGVFGVVPCYSSRVPPLVDRLLPVGDAAANRCVVVFATVAGPLQSSLLTAA
jgi:hypothetical protein